MNKERAARSINVERFISLASEAVTKADAGSAEGKIAKVRQGLTTALDYYTQDRHVELGEYWPSYIALLEAIGCPADGEASPASPTAPVASTNIGDEATVAEEEALLLAQNAEVAMNAEAVPPNAAQQAEEAKTAAEGPTRTKRVITQQEIDERAKFNAGRRRYLSHEEGWEEKEKTITSAITYLKHSVLYKESVQKCKEVQTILGDVEVNDQNTNKASEKNASKWTPTTKIDANGYGTWYRAIEGTPFHSLKVVGEVDCNVLSALAVLCELDLYKEWFPMCWHSEEQGRVGDLHRWSTFTVSCPWPVASRNIFIGGFGCDCVYQKKIVIVAKSVNLETDYIPVECNIPTAPKGTVTALLTGGGFVLEPMRGGKTKVSFTMNVDPKLKVVPTSMINWFSGKLIWVLLKNLGSAAKKAEKTNSPFFARREEQKELYEYFRVRALEVLPPDHL